MVGAGVLMFVLALVGLWLTRKQQVLKIKWLLWVLVFAIALPYLANSTGWMLTEVGRQPWIVFGLMRIDQALSPNVTVAELLITLIGFTAVYGALAAADVYLLQKYARTSVDGTSVPDEAESPAPAPKLDSVYLGGK